MNRETVSWIAISIFWILCVVVIYAREQGGLQPPKASKASLPQIPADVERPLEEYLPADSQGEFSILYHALAGTALEDKEYSQLAMLLSSEYRHTSDEFRKREMLAELRQVIDENLEAYRSRYFVMSTDIVIGHYDFETQAFPVLGSPALSTTRVRIGRNLKLQITNEEFFTRWKEEDEEFTRKFEALPGTKRRGRGMFYLYAQGVDDDKATIYAQIVHLDLYGWNKELFRRMSVPAS